MTARLIANASCTNSIAMNRMVARTRLAMRKSEEKKAASPYAEQLTILATQGRQAQEDAPWLKNGWRRDDWFHLQILRFCRKGPDH